MAMKFGLSTLTRGVFSAARTTWPSPRPPSARASISSRSATTSSCRASCGSPIPTPQGGALGAAEHGHCFDQLATIAFLAGCTERLRLLTSVHGGAAPAGDADRQDAGDHRRALQRPAHRRRRRRLDEGGVRAAGRPLRGARQGHRRVSRGLPGAVDQGRARPTAASTCASPTCCSIPSRCRSRIRRSGSAARARPRCGAPSSSAMPGIPATTARPSRSTRPARLGAGIAEVQAHGRGGRTRSGLARRRLLVQDSFEWTAHKIQDGSARRLFTGASADMAADAAALEALGVGHVALRLGGAIARGVARAHRPLRPRGDREANVVGVGTPIQSSWLSYRGLSPVSRVTEAHFSGAMRSCATRKRPGFTRKLTRLPSGHVRIAEYADVCRILDPAPTLMRGEVRTSPTSGQLRPTVLGDPLDRRIWAYNDPCTSCRDGRHWQTSVSGVWVYFHWPIAELGTLGLLLRFPASENFGPGCRPHTAMA